MVILNDFRYWCSGERMHCCVVDRKHRVLKVIVIFKIKYIDPNLTNLIPTDTSSM